MSTNAIQNAANKPAQVNCPNAGELIKQIFETYSSDDIQEALDGLLSMAAESSEFGEMSGLARNNTITFMQKIKTHFAKASVLNDKMKGGVDGAN